MSILISNLLLNIADWLTLFLWLNVGLSIESVGSGSAIVIVLVQIILFRTVLYFIVRRNISVINFYGMFIYSLTPGFIIILIGTRSDNMLWLIFLVFLKEIFSIFRAFAVQDAEYELGLKSPIYNTIERIFPWVGSVLAYAIFMYYSNNNLMDSVFAPLAILIGITTIILYNRFSNVYAKKLASEREFQKTKRVWFERGINLALGANYAAVAAAALYTVSNTLVWVSIVAGVGIILEIVKSIFIKDKKSFEVDYVLYGNFWLIGLIIALFVV